MPVIETLRLRMRPIALKDLPALAAMWSDGAVMRYLPTGEPRTVEETRVELEYMTRHWKEHGFGVWAIEMDGRFAGHCGIQYLHAEPGGVPAEVAERAREVEVVAGLARPFWGQGIAPEATRAALRYGFEVVRLDRIVAAIHPENEASRHILTSLGMRLDPDMGYYGDCPHFVITREEFQPDDAPFSVLKEQ